MCAPNRATVNLVRDAAAQMPHQARAVDLQVDLHVDHLLYHNSLSFGQIGLGTDCRP
jgi:hypothetical protein